MHPADENRRVRDLGDEERAGRLNDEAQEYLEHGDAIAYDDREEWDPHSIAAMNAEALSNLRGEQL